MKGVKAIKKYIDSNRELKRYYESQKSFITAKKNLNTLLLDRQAELRNIRASLASKYLRNNNSMQRSLPNTTPLPQNVAHFSENPGSHKISLDNHTSSSSIETSKKVTISNNLPIENKSSSSIIDRIKSIFSKIGKSLSSFFSSPDDLEDNNTPVYYKEISVAPKVINSTNSEPPIESDLSKRERQNAPRNKTNSNYYSNYHTSYGGGSIEGIQSINKTTSVNSTKPKFSHVDSLALAELLKDEKEKSKSHSSNIDSLKFSKMLREKNSKLDFTNDDDNDLDR